MGRQLLNVLFVAIVVLSAGCTGLLVPKDSAGDLTKADVLDGMDSLERYEFEFTRTTSADAGNVSVTGSGAVDETANRYRARIETEGPRTTVQERYVVDDTLYVSDESVPGSGWLRKPASADGPTGAPAEIASIAEQRLLVEAGAFEHAGTETIDGVETVVVSIDLGAAPGDALGAAVGGPRGSIEAVEYRLFVEESTGFVHGITSTIDVQGKDGLVTTRTELRLRNHNGDVDISLPEAARNATDAGGLGGEP